MHRHTYHTWKEIIEDVSPTRVSILVQKLHRSSYPRTLALDHNRGSFCPRGGASTLGQKLRGRKCPKDGSSPGAPALGEAMSCDTGPNQHKKMTTPSDLDENGCVGNLW